MQLRYPWAFKRRHDSHLHDQSDVRVVLMIGKYTFSTRS
jgi:hypothetical protein